MGANFNMTKLLPASVFPTISRSNFGRYFSTRGASYCAEASVLGADELEEDVKEDIIEVACTNKLPLLTVFCPDRFCDCFYSYYS